MDEQTRRGTEVQHFIPDNLLDEHRLLRGVQMPEMGLQKLVLDVYYDLDAAACEENTSVEDVMEDAGEEAKGAADKSKDDTPMRESPSVDCRSQDEEGEATSRMES